MSFTRLKMRATSKSINFTRNIIDYVNVGIAKVYSPISRTFDKMSSDYPVFGVFFASCAVCFIPMMALPYWLRWRDNSKRRILERERVELCLQKGIDPFPMVRYKDQVHGHNSQLTSFNEADAPMEASYEYRAVLNMRKKAESYGKVMGLSADSLVDPLTGEDPSKSLDALLAFRERERTRLNGNKLIVWQDPVDLAFPKRDDELYPTNAAGRQQSPAEEKAAFIKKAASS